MLTFYCHLFVQDTLLFSSQPAGMFATFLFSDSFLHKKLAPFPVTSHQLYFRLTCSLPCSSGVTVDFVHTELPGGSAFVLLLRKGQILWAFWHHEVTVCLKSVWRTLIDKPERWQVIIKEREKLWFRSAKSKGRWRIRPCLNTAYRNPRDSKPGNKKQFALSNENHSTLVDVIFLLRIEITLPVE